MRRKFSSLGRAAEGEARCLSNACRFHSKTSLEFLDKEVFTDVTSGEIHEADLVVKARFRNQESFFLVHGEHQAQPQAGFNRRMFQYFARLHEQHALPVYPIVIFSHDSARLEPDVYEVAFPDLTVLRFQYRAIQLSRLNWRVLWLAHKKSSQENKTSTYSGLGVEG